MLTNIVMMGMGEPLYNFDNVRDALKIVMDGDGLGLSRRRITLSTSGVVPMMARAGEEIGVNLAVSLHAVTKEIRDEIVPLNRKYGIEQLLEACAAYPGANNARRITFEYVMLKDKNDSDEDARELVRLIRQLQAAGQGQSDPVQPVARRGLRMFGAASGSGRSATSSSKPGISAPVRTPRGRDIDAACGQLKTAAEKKRRSGGREARLTMLSPVRRALVRQVRSTFNDQSKGEKPVPASDDALFPPGSVIRRVHGDVTSMMVGGIAALLTQMLHPQALAGVWDHSDVACRHARPAAANRAVHRRHHLWPSRLGRGGDRQGQGDPRAGQRHAARRQRLSRDRSVAARLGPCRRRDQLPRRLAALCRAAHEPRATRTAISPRAARSRRCSTPTRCRARGAEAERLIARLSALSFTPTSARRAFRDLVLKAPPRSLAEAPMQALLMNAAVDLMPPFARDLHGLSQRPLRAGGARRDARARRTLRWAFAGERYRAER